MITMALSSELQYLVGLDYGNLSDLFTNSSLIQTEILQSTSITSLFTPRNNPSEGSGHIKTELMEGIS